MKAIFTLDIAGDDTYLPCLQSMNFYCKRYSIDYIVARIPKLKFINVYFEKFQAFNLFSFGYDQVLCVDRDVMATPRAANIFSRYNDPNFNYAYFENSHDEWMNRDQYIQCLPVSFEWPKQENGKLRYFNSGVILYGKNNLKFLQDIGTFEIPNNMLSFGEQTFLNYLFSKNNITIMPMDYSFNRMDLGKEDSLRERYQANFIHYAGPCKYGGNKREVIYNDYKALYGTI